MAFPVNHGACFRVDSGRAWSWSMRCLLCGESAAPGIELCAACGDGLPWNRRACLRCALPLQTAAAACGACLQRPPPLTETHAALVYGVPLDRLLLRFKFHGDLAAGRLLARCLLAATQALPRPDALIPIPLHRARLRTRGYDQALELARPLARHLRLPLRDDTLLRTRDTAAQSRLDARHRRDNLRRAFAVRTLSPLPAHVVLIDDVMTTGATLHAAATALLRAGVARVDAWVCARVP